MTLLIIICICIICMYVMVIRIITKNDKNKTTNINLQNDEQTSKMGLTEGVFYPIHIKYIKKACDVPVIKAVSVQSTEDILRWRHSLCDILLLDNGAGGTGESFDWNLIEDINKPFFIAGGINEKNVLKALAKKPYGIDVSGGVETDGFKDPAKIKNIIETIRRGD